MTNLLEQRAREFHLDNPHVYDLFERFTFEAINAGYRNFSVAAIWERMRWECMIETSDPEFKLNNNHKAYYARWFMRKHPQYDGFFRTRTVHGEEVAEEWI